MSQEGNWLLAVTFFEATNPVFNIIVEHNGFSIIIPGPWRIPNYLEDGVINKLKNLLKLRCQKDIELHVKEIRKRGKQLKVGDEEYKLSDFDTFKKEKLGELKSNKYHDLEDLVYRMGLTYAEIMDILDIKFFPSERTGYTLPPGIYGKSDINKTLEHLLPDNLKVSNTIDDIRLRSNLYKNQTLKFTKKNFLYHFRLYTIHSGPFSDIDGFAHLVPGKYKSDKIINVTGIDKVHLKCDSIHGSIVNGIRGPILFSLGLSSPLGHKILKQPSVKFFKKNNKYVLSHMTFFLEDDDHKSVDCDGETISFTFQLIEI